jgi:hypothetical protein
VDYDYVFGIGVSPNDLWFGIWSKKEIKELTVSMTKDGSFISFLLQIKHKSFGETPIPNT